MKKKTVSIRTTGFYSVEVKTIFPCKIGGIANKDSIVQVYTHADKHTDRARTGRL